MYSRDTGRGNSREEGRGGAAAPGRVQAVRNAAQLASRARSKVAASFVRKEGCCELCAQARLLDRASSDALAPEDSVSDTDATGGAGARVRRRTSLPGTAWSPSAWNPPCSPAGGASSALASHPSADALPLASVSDTLLSGASANCTHALPRAPARRPLPRGAPPARLPGS